MTSVPQEDASQSPRRQRSCLAFATQIRRPELRSLRRPPFVFSIRSPGALSATRTGTAVVSDPSRSSSSCGLLRPRAPVFPQSARVCRDDLSRVLSDHARQQPMHEAQASPSHSAGPTSRTRSLGHCCYPPQWPPGRGSPRAVENERRSSAWFTDALRRRRRSFTPTPPRASTGFFKSS